ncbi:hypothetical protein H4696_008807 [Amycolatopsis lexingtonensis]|uniref:Uncharacterized protein n=1 Tax=Amycolatopsis lexingtonensis TaxID=218822 RepID=A0ABR9IEU1_9PSEU|nr:hypothetical protein [Amycolatopsis lexingtonensis]MBE1501707.1 hypothetical protein [Amycolatopsis lexingtonensis]
MTGLWVRGPVGLDAGARVTRPRCRVVLVVVPSVTAGTRLVELVSLLEPDLRVQVVYTVPHTTERWPGAEEFVRGLHGLVLPWEQALAHRFDLVLAASPRQLAEVHGPVLLVGHGAGPVSRRFSRKAGQATEPTTGFDRELLTFRGRVLPSVLGLGTDAEADLVRERCPEALPNAVVAGDICYDRMRASRHRRDAYRAALGVPPDRRLVVISTTWFTDSAFGRLPRLYRDVVDALPSDEFTVAAILHPLVWAVHGRRQVSAWLSDAVARGLLLIPPESGWQATMLAADWVIGDHGSTTGYAAAMGCPVTYVSMPAGQPREGSVAAAVRTHALPLTWGRPLPEQLDSARERVAELAAAATGAITSRPDRAAEILRAAMYRLLELSAPASPAVPPLVPAPCPLPAWSA